MNIREIVEEHARVCRKALVAGKVKPRYEGPGLAGADLAGADLTNADLAGASLAGALLTRAVLWDANLMGANLTRVVLSEADLMGANLANAVLWDANLTGADLTGALLTRAGVTGATLSDGRTFEQWRADPLAGLCTEPEAVQRAVKAWGKKSWKDCPMHEAHGWEGYRDAGDKNMLLAVFVALHDANLLPKPERVCLKKS